jgi:hypothetical protein
MHIPHPNAIIMAPLSPQPFTLGELFIDGCTIFLDRVLVGVPLCPYVETNRGICAMTYARIQEWLDEGNYTGDLKDGKPHGQGTITYANGNKYAGEWRNGLRNGQGTCIWPGGTKYVGEFRDGHENGQGTRTWPSGRKYVGEFQDGYPHGWGTETSPYLTYVGEWRDGQEHGTRGTTTFPPRQGK